MRARVSRHLPEDAAAQYTRKVIVSASRRTDIPAFYLDWLLGRLAAGWCLVRSPYDASFLRRVALDPAEVDCVVLWTRDLRKLVARTREIELMGFSFYVHVTLCAYPKAIEPAGLGVEAGIDALRELADAVGSERALWRYDPVFVARGIDADFHRASFERIAARLEGSTSRVSLSLLDEYAGTAARLGRAGFPDVVFGSPKGADGADGVGGPLRRGPPEPYPALLADMAAIARARGIEPVACAEPYDLAPCGIGRASCVDASLVARLRGEAPVDRGPDKGQRPECGCAPSVDIGAYGSCPAGCAYCYANRGTGRLAARGPEDEAL
jgi:hypothetical protein